MHPNIPKKHSNIALPDLLSGLMLIINFNNFLTNQLTVATLYHITDYIQAKNCHLIHELIKICIPL